MKILATDYARNIVLLNPVIFILFNSQISLFCYVCYPLHHSHRSDRWDSNPCPDLYKICIFLLHEIFSIILQAPIFNLPIKLFLRCCWEPSQTFL